MRLKSLEYSQYTGRPQEWTLRGLTLGDVNLLVGRNASGKSRILNVIHNLARAITGNRSLQNGQFSVTFDNDGAAVEYELEMLEGGIVRELFTVDGKKHLDRGPGGQGRIFAVKEDKHIEFQTPANQLAVLARRDTVQHPYFEPLHQWAGSLYHYDSDTSLGKESLAVFIKSDGEKSEVDPKDPAKVVAIFRRGKEEFGDDFMNAVQEDFNSIGYLVDDVGLDTPFDVKLEEPIPGKLAGMYVKESDLPCVTDQNSMSRGMFRALSIIVQVNYSVLADTPSCILVDDIGEGLDFECSCDLIDVLMRKAKDSSVQLLMATNDRFVMNRVPLEVWSVVDRQRNRVEIRNYANSKEIFDKFKFTGLNNFDFLAFDYLHAGTTDEQAGNLCGRPD